jgi:type III pantothenate kinase
MKPSLVADVGNSRVKWGRCQDGRVVETVSLPADPASWQMQLERWNISSPQAWALSGVHPYNRDLLAKWLEERCDQVEVIRTWQQLRLRVLLEQPGEVGIDRLLNAVAVLRGEGRGARDESIGSTRPSPLPPHPCTVPAIIIDAGSAVTVDWLDESGAFCGGAIFPGLRLMAQALHDHTALLPLVSIDKSRPPVPGLSTIAAIEAGVFWATVGGIKASIDELSARSSLVPQRFLAGGDAPLLADCLGPGIQHRPNLTLEGIRLTAEDG